jgi:peroxiredoxin
VKNPSRLVNALSAAHTQHGGSVAALSDDRALLLVLLRHFGCTFCREALSDIAARRAEIEASGATIVLVHMTADRKAREFFARYGLDDVPRVSDPERALYRALGLGEAELMEVLTKEVFRRGAEAWREGHRLGWLARHPLQMPGLFLVYRGEVADSFRHARVSDRPDYLGFVRGGEGGS